MLCGMCDLPRPGIEPVSPALAGGFLTTAPPGKPEAYVLTDRNIAYLGSCEEVDSWLPLLLSGNFLLPAPSEGDKRGISDLVKEFLNLPASHLSPKRSTAIPCVWVNVCINIRICVYVCKYMCLYIHIHHLFIHAVIHSLN